MSCLLGRSRSTVKRTARIPLSYRIYYCRTCRRRFNERTGTPFNTLQFSTDMVLMAVLWSLRYKLGFRDVAELLLQRGFEVSHELFVIGSSDSHRMSLRVCEIYEGGSWSFLVPGRDTCEGQAVSGAIRSSRALSCG